MFAFSWVTLHVSGKLWSMNFMANKSLRSITKTEFVQFKSFTWEFCSAFVLVMKTCYFGPIIDWEFSFYPLDNTKHVIANILLYTGYPFEHKNTLFVYIIWPVLSRLKLGCMALSLIACSQILRFSWDYKCLIGLSFFTLLGKKWSALG